MNESLFFFLSAVSVLSALLVVFSKNPVHSVLFLILAFFSIAGQYVLMNAQFLAIVHIIVYAGAIMVLFLFVLMLLNLKPDKEPVKNIYLKIASVVGAGMLLITLTGALKNTSIPNAALHNPELGMVQNLGQKLFGDFLVPFELSSILFLSAMVGAVLVGKKEKEVTSI